MITKKRLIVPIFDYSITIVIYDKWSDLEGILDDDLFRDSRANGITVNYGNYSLVCIDKKYYSTIVHEAGHLVNSIWRYIGYTPMRDNDEVDQYLVTYIYNKIVDVFYKHNNIKDNLMRDTN